MLDAAADAGLTNATAEVIVGGFALIGVLATGVLGVVSTRRSRVRSSEDQQAVQVVDAQRALITDQQARIEELSGTLAIVRAQRDAATAERNACREQVKLQAELFRQQSRSRASRKPPAE